MTEVVLDEFSLRNIPTKDADASTGGKDFVDRILSLICGTGFTVAIFSHDTRATALANITLELGFAAMCGKPLMIVKSFEAAAPSDFTRTDWINYDLKDENRFRQKLRQALDTITEIAVFEETLLEVALNARSIDCAIAFERAIKAFLLTSEGNRPVVAVLRFYDGSGCSVWNGQGMSSAMRLIGCPSAILSSVVVR